MTRADNARSKDALPTRSAALTVASLTLSVEELVAALAVTPDALQRRGEPQAGLPVPVPSRFNTWKIESSGDATSSLKGHLDAVLTRARPLQEPLRALFARDCLIRLDLTWNTHDDPTGLGFILTTEQVGFLSSIGAMVNADPTTERDGSRRLPWRR